MIIYFSSVSGNIPIGLNQCGENTFCRITEYCNISECLPCENLCLEFTSDCLSSCFYVGWFAKGKTQNELDENVRLILEDNSGRVKENDVAIVNSKTVLLVSGIVGWVLLILLIGIGLVVYAIIRYLRKKRKEKRDASTGVLADSNKGDKGQRQPCL